MIFSLCRYVASVNKALQEIERTPLTTAKNSHNFSDNFNSMEPLRRFHLKPLTNDYKRKLTHYNLTP